MRKAGEDAKMTLLSMPELSTLQERMDPSARDSLLSTVGTFLKANSADGQTAARIGETGFSLIHDGDTDIAELEDEIAAFTREVDPDGEGIEIESAVVDADDETVSDEDMVKGLMFTLNQFQQSTDEGLSLKDLSSNFGDFAKAGVERVQNFKHIVRTGAFDPAFHPIVNVKTGAIHHYEALVRFRQLGKDASPFQEITFAEEAGLIHEFDIAMARKVLTWLSSKPRNSDAYNVAVNVSGNSIGNLQYVDALHRLLRENDWAQGKLIFEITESARMTDLEAADRFIQSLRSEGYHVCLDDFGAGAASFQYLSALDVDVVKLDGSAVRNAQKNEKGRAFFSALTEFCGRLGVETVAEMIDSPQSLHFVTDCGVDFVQGFLFGKPTNDLKAFNPLPHKDLITSR